MTAIPEEEPVSIDVVKEVRILGKLFRISAAEPEPAFDPHGVCGAMFLHTNSIVFRSAMSADEIRETVLHEVIHAIADCLHIKIKEHAVHAMSAGIYQVLRDNPQFAKMYVETDGDNKADQSI